MFNLKSCAKKYTREQDKAASPAETIQNVQQAFSAFGSGVLQQTKRIDTGRLDIPVYLSMCGSQARTVMPTRKQMGKGASPEQAQASALMELAERFSLFSFFTDEDIEQRLTWSQAQEKWSGQLIPLQQILRAVHEENLEEHQAREILDLVPWRFVPALDVHRNLTSYLPLDLFKKLNEFNGSSAGNSFEESVLQGACELVERHVSALIDQNRPVLPSIDPQTINDPILKDLYDKFQAQGIKIWLKDFSLGLGIPTVGVLAYDPATFPGLSEIVFTAGTATSPQKAAIRALTETAQLAGDFRTGSNYDPSGLSKFKTMQDCAWIKDGPLISLAKLPDFSDPDIHVELRHLTEILQRQGFELYSVDTSHPKLLIPCNYNIVPGFLFRERAAGASLGLFVGRILAEEYPEQFAWQGLQTLARHYPYAHYIPFFQGLVQIRAGNNQQATMYLQSAAEQQPEAQDRALIIFYLAYVHSLEQNWPETEQLLQEAIHLSPEVHAYYNLRGVARFKLKQYNLAARDFQQALDLDQGSALDLANLGLCYEKMNKPRAAMDFLQSSLELDPDLDFAAQHLQKLQQDFSVLSS